MLTLILLAVFEVAIVVLPNTALPAQAVAGLLSLLLISLTGLSALDHGAGFITRLAWLFALAWYMGSIGRWIPQLSEIYSSSTSGGGLALAAALLLIAPLGLLLVSITGPAMHAVGRFRNRE